MDFIPPSFYIMGERKCGTSSLYRYIVTHPYVLPCKLKEPQFFSKHSPEYIAENIKEYHALFPSRKYTGDLVLEWPELNKNGILIHEKVDAPRLPNREYITGEASANSFCEVPPALLHQYLPDVKLILLMRNPVDRAFSHHRMYQRFQEEGRDLGMVVGDFAEDIRKAMEDFQNGIMEDYVSPGVYLPRLKEWLTFYPKERIRIYFTEDMARPEGAKAILDDIQEYLYLPYHDYGDFLSQKFNQAPPANIDPALRAELQDFFAPYNRELETFLGRSLPWDD